MIIITILIVAINLQAMWEHTNGPEGGKVNKIIRHGDFLFVATGGGLGENGSVYRSADDGENWSLVSQSFEMNYGVYDIVQNDSYIFAGTKGFGAYRSSDNGVTWDHLNELPGLIQVNVNSMYADNDIVVIGTLNDGVFFSNDNGSSWAAMGNQLNSNSRRIAGIIKHQDTFYIAATDAAFKLVNESWIPITTITDPFLEDIETDGTNIYFSGIWNTFILDPQTMAVTTTANQGSHWFYSYNDKIFTSDYQTLYISEDFGVTWTTIDTGLIDPSLTSNAFYAEEDFWIIANEAFSIFKTTDEGQTWNRSSKGIANITVNDFTVFNNQLYAVTEFADFGRIFATSNSGDDWFYSEEGTNQIGYFSIFANDDFMLAGSFGAGMYRSEDGLNWTHLTFNEFLPSYPSQIIKHNGAIYAGAFGFSVDLYKSSDDGFSFQPLNVPGEGFIFALQSFENKLYYGRTDGVYFSEDDGDTWTPQNNGFTANPFINDFEEFNGSLYVVAGQQVMYYNENEMWEHIVLPDNPWVKTIANVEDYLLIGTKEDGIFKLTSDGMITQLNDGLPMGISGIYPSIMKFYSDDEYLYVSAEMFGVFKTSLTTTDISDDVVVPSRINMSVYPNPFNPTTTISYTLDKGSDVSVEVYNLRGQLIKELKQGFMRSGVTHEVVWNGNDKNNQQASSGIYFIKLNAGTKTEMRKAILLK